MPILSSQQIEALLAPYVGETMLHAHVVPQLSAYLDLLLKWNARTNLTSIRDPESIVRRHFGESLFAAKHMAPLLDSRASVLDFGSGAGFPGVPIQILLPHLRITVAESQHKKAAFLREVIRTLGLTHTEVWADRVETMLSDRKFDAVTLRAVDRMAAARGEARLHLKSEGWLVTLSADRTKQGESFKIPGADDSWLSIERVD